MPRDDANPIWATHLSECVARLGTPPPQRPFPLTGPDGSSVWCRLCRCADTCRCGVETEARILAQGLDKSFLPFLVCFTTLSIDGKRIRANCIRDYTGTNATPLSDTDAGQLGIALAWLHGLDPGAILTSRPEERCVVIHGDVFSSNLVRTGAGLQLVDFADGRAGFRSEDLLAALSLDFCGQTALQSFVREYRRAAGIALADLGLEVGVEAEFGRRQKRRNRDGVVDQTYLDALMTELKQSGTILREEFAKPCRAY